MAKLRIKCDLKKFERQLNRSIEKIVKDKQREAIVENNLLGEDTMRILSETEETMLLVLLSKSDNGTKIDISGKCEEFPKYMHFNFKNLLEKLKLLGYISYGQVYMGGDWHVILTPDAISYFQKKGMREELFEELTEQAKELLKEILEEDKNKNDIGNFLSNKIKEDELNRGMIGKLEREGLLRISWASGTTYYAELTYEGRTYFEREKKYMEKIEKMRKPSVSIGNLTNTGFLNMGNITDSSVVINNSVEQLEKEIEENGQEDKEELRQILNEVRDYIDNINATKSIQKNTGLFKRIGNHLEKHQWFYSQIVGILGQTLLLGMGNQV